MRRSAITFYGVTSNSLKATSGQISSGLHNDSSSIEMIGFQQPLAYRINSTLNQISDTIICESSKIVLKAGKSIFYKWFKNDTLLVNQITDTLQVSTAGVYKLVVSDGITQFDTSKAIKITYLIKPIKPIISINSSDTLYCILDTLRLNASIGYDKYIWSTGDTAQSILTRYIGDIYTKGGKRIGTSNNFCFSDTSDIITTRKNYTPIPTITRLTNDLISSQSNAYRWYMDNKLLSSSNTNTLKIPSKGFFRVEESLDKVCWSISKDYIIQGDIESSDQKDFSLSAYPNPTGGQFYLTIKLDHEYSGKAQIQIVDVNGITQWSFSKLIYSDNNIRLPFSLKLNKGTYTIQVKLNGYKTKAIKIIAI